MKIIFFIHKKYVVQIKKRGVAFEPQQKTPVGHGGVTRLPEKPRLAKRATAEVTKQDMRKPRFVAGLVGSLANLFTSPCFQDTAVESMHGFGVAHSLPVCIYRHSCDSSLG